VPSQAEPRRRMQMPRARVRAQDAGDRLISLSLSCGSWAVGISSCNTNLTCAMPRLCLYEDYTYIQYPIMLTNARRMPRNQLQSMYQTKLFISRHIC
jgi:hypothetical protein